MLPNVSIKESYGVKYMIFDSKDFKSSDFITHMVRITGQFELDLVLAAEQALLKSNNGIVLDIGANFGTFSIPFAKRNSNMVVMAFEPQRIIFNQLCGNVILNSLDNVFTYNFAISDTEDSILTITPDYNREINIGGFSFDPLVKEKCPTTKGEEELINIITIDSLDLSNVVFIKIDVEGMELNVLKGALETIKRCNYPPIIFEAWHQFDWYEQRKKELLDFVRDLGYNLTMPYENNFLAKHNNNQ